MHHLHSPKPELSGAKVFLLSVSLALAANTAFLYAFNCKLMASVPATTRVAAPDSRHRQAVVTDADGSARINWMR
jgi:hypothetical protein